MHWMSMLWTQLLVVFIACVLGWYAECWYFTWHTVAHCNALTLVWIATLLLHPIICSFIFMWGEKHTTFIILSNLTMNNYVLVASVFIKLQHISGVFWNCIHSKWKCMKTSRDLDCMSERNVMLSNIVHQSMFIKMLFVVVMCCFAWLACIQLLGCTVRHTEGWELVRGCGYRIQCRVKTTRGPTHDLQFVQKSLKSLTTGANKLSRVSKMEPHLKKMPYALNKFLDLEEVMCKVIWWFYTIKNSYLDSQQTRTRVWQQVYVAQINGCLFNFQNPTLYMHSFAIYLISWTCQPVDFEWIPVVSEFAMLHFGTAIWSQLFSICKFSRQLVVWYLLVRNIMFVS